MARISLAGIVCMGPGSPGLGRTLPVPLPAGDPPLLLTAMPAAPGPASSASAGDRAILAHHLVDALEQPRSQVVDIVRMVTSAQPRAEGPLPARPSLAALNVVAQAQLLRPPGAERGDARDLAHYRRLLAPLTPASQAQLMCLFEQLGQVGAVPPAAGDYDYLLVHGGTVGMMRARLMYLATALVQGEIGLTSVAQVIFLQGERPLSRQEREVALLDPAPYRARPGWQAPAQVPDDERMAAVWIWDQLDLPAILRRRRPLYVDACRRPGQPRAQTEDCVGQWLVDYAPASGRALMVSNNPFVVYQRLVTRLSLARLGFHCLQLEACGPAAVVEADPIVSLAPLLDSLARSLYVQRALTAVGPAP